MTYQNRIKAMEPYLNPPEYKNCFLCQQHQLLWYSERPDSRKNTISLYMAQRIKQMHSAFWARIAFFFCQSQKDTSSTTAAASIISLLKSGTILGNPPNFWTYLSRSDHSFERSYTLKCFRKKKSKQSIGGRRASRTSDYQ